MKVAIVLEKNVTQILDVENEEAVQDLMKKFPVVVELSEYDPEPKVGWEWDGAKLFDPEGAGPSRKITKLGLRQRLTFSELMALTTASKTIVAVEALMGNLTVATYVDLNRADTVGAMNLLVSLGLISAERGQQILNNPIQDQEKYRGEK
jgi:hypothetical protein